MKVTNKIALIIASLAPCVAIAGEWTTTQAIAQIQYDGEADTLWLLGPVKWGASGCPNATWIVVQASVAGREQIMSLAAAAQMAGKNVAFWGTCDPGIPDRFNATFIKVE